jgi:hypothetical protein
MTMPMSTFHDLTGQRFDRLVCQDCLRNIDHRAVQLAPMLLNEVWQQLAENPKDVLCVDCISIRAAARKITLSLASLKPCPFNVLPWFKLFLGKESAPPANMDAWEAAMREDLMMRRQVLNYQQKAALR